MDLSHLRDELANPQMDGPPAHRATHSALSAQFKQTAFNLTHFWRSSLRANENSYHRGYLAALADLREMLARIDRAEEGIDTSTRQPVSGAEQRSRLQHYLTARMEAVAEDVKATSSTLDSGASSASPNPTAAESHHDSGQPSSSQASSSHPSSSQQQIPSSPSRPAGFRLGSADAQPLRQVSAFASSTSAFNRPAGPPDSALRSLGSGIALGSSESSTPDSTQTQEGSNTAARMARLRWGRPRMRDQSAPSEADHRQSSSQETAAPSSSQQSTSSAFRSREMETDQPSSSPMVSAQSTPQTAQRPPNSLVERVALAKVARANMLSASDRSAGGVGSNASPSINSASDPATTTRGTASGHHADSPAPVEVEPTPPSTPISPLRQVQPTASSAQPASPSALLTRTTDTPNAFNFTSPSRFFSIPSAFGSSPTLGNNGTGTTTTTTAGGGGAASSFLSPSAKAPRTSSKFNSNRGSSFSRAPSTAAAEHHTDDEDERSDGGAESDVEPLRMPMVRRRPPTRTASDSDSDGGKEGFLAGLGSTAAGVGRPRKRRK